MREPRGAIDLTPLYNGLVPESDRVHVTAAVFDPSSGTVYVAADVADDVASIVAIDRDGEPRGIWTGEYKDWQGLVVCGPGQLFGLTETELVAIEDVKPIPRVHTFAGLPQRTATDRPRGGLRAETVFEYARGLAISNILPRKLAVWQARGYQTRAPLMEVQLAGQNPLHSEAVTRVVPVSETFVSHTPIADVVNDSAEANYVAGVYSLDDQYLFAMWADTVVAVHMATGAVWPIWQHGIGYDATDVSRAQGLMVDRDGTLVAFGQAKYYLNPMGLMYDLGLYLTTNGREKQIGFGPDGMALVAVLGRRRHRAIRFEPRKLDSDREVARKTVEYQSPDSRVLVGALVVALYNAWTGPRMRRPMIEQLVAATRRSRFVGDVTRLMLDNAPFQV